MSSPAERYARSRERGAWQASPAGRFAGSLDFELDGFQREGIAAVQEGLGVLVAAPTGAGKTTLLGALLGEADPGDRIVTIEDVAELVVRRPHVV